MLNPKNGDSARALSPTQREIVELSKILSSESRLRILMLLSHEPELNVGELCDRLRQRQPVVSHHLALMRTAGLLKTRRAGKQRFYRLHRQRVCRVLERLLSEFHRDRFSRRQEDGETTKAATPPRQAV
ncbi:MAG: ArsR family transcriptional regulator [Planctomycetota bacterium]|nr:MAG: ArsR family transcriptional regulator [Planctomycetota bacterium]